MQSVIINDVNKYQPDAKGHQGSASQFSENPEIRDSFNSSQNSDQQVQTSNSQAESISIKDSYILKKNGVLTNLKKDVAISDISNSRDSVYHSDSVIISKKSVSQTHTPIMAILERILERSKLSKHRTSPARACNATCCRLLKALRSIHATAS